MTATEDCPLRFESLSKAYGRPVLDDVTLSVPTGSVLGFLGKNGAGKTTLIRCALGLAQPDKGRALMFGEQSTALSADAKARLGYVPQETSLYSWMRAGQLLDYTAAFYPRWNSDLVAKLLTEWEVRAGDRIGKMSVGTRHKLAIILALAHEPELLILDEPAASLDPSARREFLKTVLTIAADERRTIVFSTHITSDLERVANRLVILRDGRIAYDGELDALKDSMKRLHVTAAAPLPAVFTVPGAIRTQIEGNEALVSVRDASDDLLARIRSEHGAAVRVEDLNLEEIFLEVQYVGQA